jgi:hypothetical protein
MRRTVLSLPEAEKSESNLAPDLYVWPESTIGSYHRGVQTLLKVEVLGAAQKKGQAHVIGLDFPVKKQHLNAALAFVPDGTEKLVVARQPAPAALWRPWSDQTYVRNWMADSHLEFEGKRLAFTFCYEEYIPILYLLNEWRYRPTVSVVMANTWAARNPEMAAIQTAHSKWMAKLFSRPYVKAENRPITP